MPTTATFANFSPTAASLAKSYLQAVSVEVTEVSALNPLTGVVFTAEGRSFPATVSTISGTLKRATAKVYSRAGKSVTVGVAATTADANVNNSSWAYTTRRVQTGEGRMDALVRQGLAHSARADYVSRGSEVYTGRVDHVTRALGLETLSYGRVDYAVRENARGYLNAFLGRVDILVVEEVVAALAPVGCNVGEHGAQALPVGANVRATAHQTLAPVGANTTGTTPAGLISVGANVVDFRRAPLVPVGCNVGEWAARMLAVGASIAPAHALALLEIVVASQALQTAEEEG